MSPMITVDGRQIEARDKELVIAAAERAGVYIPRFCYHPRMRPVGMCRMCLVEQETPRGPMLVASCMIEAADGMVIDTQSPTVKKAQDGVLEFLLANHPLDCPVCDKGGECPLQDQTLSFGPGETRFVEEKRHWEKPIELSSLVYMDRERCILCDRCTRFSKEVAGDPLIHFIGRGSQTQVNTFPDHPFASYFSGNTVQICPVGALLSRPYRFKARPWDLEQVESTCTTCAVGCRIAVQSSSNELVRYVGLDSDPVNHGWLCDKGRYGFEAVNSDERVTAPLIKKAGEFVEVSWGEALDAAAAGLKRVSAEGIGVIGGARLANEDAYAWSKLAKKTLGTDNVDAQLGDGLPAEAVLGLPRATIDDCDNADAVVLLGPDVKEELPVLYLRLRSAAADRGVPFIEIAPTATAMAEHAKLFLGYRPGEAPALVRSLIGEGGEAAGVSAGEIAAARQLLDGKSNIVVVLGRASVSEPGETVAEAAALLAQAWSGAKFLPALRRGNVHGALDMGLAPGMLPGRVTLEDGRQWFVDAWGDAPEQRGMGTADMIDAAVAGDLRALVLLGADPVADYPDPALAAKALEKVPFIVAVDSFISRSAEYADVILPAAMFGERSGTTTNVEGRITRLGQKITPPALAWPDWMIASELAFRLGGDLGFSSLADVWAEIERVAPSHRGITDALLDERANRDGVVAPLSRDDSPSPSHPSTEEYTVEPAHAAVEQQGTTEDTSSAEAPADVEHEEHEAPPEVDEGLPPLVRFTAGQSPALPKLDSYSTRLVATRTLWDEGATSTHSPSLRSLAKYGVVRVNPHDLERLGIASGEDVRVRGAKGNQVYKAVADGGVPRGSVAMWFNVPGADAADWIDGNSTVTDVRLETP